VASRASRSLRPYPEGNPHDDPGAPQAGSERPNLPCFQEHEQVNTRPSPRPRAIAGWPADFTRRSTAARRQTTARVSSMSTARIHPVFHRRRGVSTLHFRGASGWCVHNRFTRPTAYADARGIAGDVTTAYVDGDIDRLENHYNQLRLALTPDGHLIRFWAASAGGLLERTEVRRTEVLRTGMRPTAESSHQTLGSRGSTSLIPRPLARSVPDYVDIDYRALLESTVLEHGAL